MSVTFREKSFCKSNVPIMYIQYMACLTLLFHLYNWVYDFYDWHTKKIHSKIYFFGLKCYTFVFSIKKSWKMLQKFRKSTFCKKKHQHCTPSYLCSHLLYAFTHTTIHFLSIWYVSYASVNLWISINCCCSFWINKSINIEFIFRLQEYIWLK